MSSLIAQNLHLRCNMCYALDMVREAQQRGYSVREAMQGDCKQFLPRQKDSWTGHMASNRCSSMLSRCLRRYHVGSPQCTHRSVKNPERQLDRKHQCRKLSCRGKTGQCCSKCSRLPLHWCTLQPMQAECQPTSPGSILGIPTRCRVKRRQTTI